MQFAARIGTLRVLCFGGWRRRRWMPVIEYVLSRQCHVIVFEWSAHRLLLTSPATNAPMNTHEPMPQRDEVSALLAELVQLRRLLLDEANARLQSVASRDPDGNHSVSARNLAYYLAMRCRDLRPLQMRLARQGLSSLGRVEAHVLASIDQVIRVLTTLGGQPEPILEPLATPGFDAGNELLTINTRRIFGPPQPRRTVRAMVTMPTEAATDETLVRALLESGMDCARINCAHDDVTSWRRMIEHVRRAEQVVGRGCRVLMDLAGHKIRTGALDEVPTRTRLRPRRSEAGAVPAVARVALLPQSCSESSLPPDDFDACLTLDSEQSARIQPGDRLEFTDLRGKKRHLEIMRALAGGGWLSHCHKDARMGPDTELAIFRMRAGRWTRVDAGPVHLAGHPVREVRIRLHAGDQLRLTSPAIPGRPARTDAAGRIVETAQVGITAPEILHRLRPGQPVWIDDGKAGAILEEVHEDSVMLRITQTPPGGFRLKPDKGINLPGAVLGLSPLSEKDLADLDFVVKNADLVGFSFVETGADMLALIDELERRGASGMGIVAKIETGRALRNLPEIMLSTIGRHPLAVMIARGDLAVEIGGERLAEIQEEILWLAEAGHVPVIWATQVLETMAKTGAVSRPELSDAAMSVRAECVMLNKGPFIVMALRVLDGILHRMQDHQHKKMSQLRALQLASREDPLASPATAIVPLVSEAASADPTIHVDPDPAVDPVSATPHASL